ncbi:HAD-IA family hydrolase [Microbacterium lacticum]
MNGRAQRWRTRGLLFDLDGTLVDSSAAIARAWSAVASRHSFPVEDILPLLPGRRAIDVLKLLELSAIDRKAELVRLEAEQQILGPLRPIRGADTLLLKCPPERWAVVTAAPASVARARLRAAGLPLPQVLIAAESVAQGKPAPDGYLRAAAALDLAPGDCVVFEDAVIGIDAARSAGCCTIAIGAQIRGADHHIADYDELQDFRADGGEISWTVQERAGRTRNRAYS